MKQAIIAIINKHKKERNDEWTYKFDDLYEELIEDIEKLEEKKPIEKLLQKKIMMGVKTERKDKPLSKKIAEITDFINNQ
jgi:hypothetical protein